MIQPDEEQIGLRTQPPVDRSTLSTAAAPLYTEFMGMDISNLAATATLSDVTLSENRTHLRQPKHLEAVLSALKGNGVSGRGIVTELSHGGLRLDSPFKLQRGEEIGFQFSLPNRVRVNGKGRVCWVQSGLLTNFYGLEFVRLGFLGRHHLRGHLEPRRLRPLNAIDSALKCGALCVGLLALQEFWRNGGLFRDALFTSLPEWAIYALAASCFFLFVSL